MSEKCDALRHAIVAFSALIYSMKIDLAAREQAFLYYALALQQLRALLDEMERDSGDVTDGEYQVAIATALQLSVFDVLSHYFRR